MQNHHKVIVSITQMLFTDNQNLYIGWITILVEQTGEQILMEQHGDILLDGTDSSSTECW